MDDNKYLTFNIKKQLYGIEVSSVIEINRMCDITKIPNTHESVKGIINLRGKVVPVVDLRTKLNIEEIPYGNKHCIIVVDSGEKLIGLIVDTVDSVISLENEITNPPSALNNATEINFIKGISRLKESSILILDLDTCISEEYLTKSMDISSYLGNEENQQKAS